MPADQIEHEYDSVAAEFGPSVANRWLYATMYKAGKRNFELGDFYQMYGGDRAEHRDLLDVCGFNQLYDNHPCDKRSPIYYLTDGLSAQWFEWLKSARGVWGKWLIGFIHISLRLADRDESIEVLDSIARDEGEGKLDDGARFCFWYPGWRGWVAFSDNLTDDETTALRLTVEWLSGAPPKFPRHPEPGSPEAEMKYPSKRPETDHEEA
ncbi:hypothetical protein [Burkholderia cenocepacia]|uniref:hypothetical protein n=1 Tax=Burkholderia cenocepacia TaxID=95486 RepID=UPI0006AC03CA|nr:hypothetical protein [Burkholderia cenocepacia]KOR19433.1 hypothetical protein ABW54_21895 [Burkholderia cenocepacia]